MPDSVEDLDVLGVDAALGEATILCALLDATPDAVVVVDADGIIEEANPAVEDLFGYRPADLVGRSIEILLPESFRSRHARHRRHFAANPASRPMGVGLALVGRTAEGHELPIDVSLAPFSVAGSAKVAAFVRGASGRRRNEFLLRFVNEISQMLLTNQPTDEILQHTAFLVCQLIDASTSYVASPSANGNFVVVAAAGVAGSMLGTEFAADGTLSQRAMESGTPLYIDDMSADPEVIPATRALEMGPGVYLPLATNDRRMGTLVVARTRDEPAFSEQEVSRGQVFASAVAVVKSLGQARSELDGLRTTAANERIARALHSGVINHIFSLGIDLDGIAHLVPVSISDELDKAIADLDGVIRQIRETVFHH